jgi:phage protein U
MIGSYGPIIFTVSSLRALTFNDFTRNASKRTASHEVIKGKPRTEYLGAGLQTVSFKIKLDATYGVRPRAMIEALVQMAENRMAYPLIIGGRPIGFHSWSLDSIAASDDVMYNWGELAQAEVTLNLTEYIEMM